METATPTLEANGNGNEAAALDPLEQHAEQLEELLAPLAARRAQLEAELFDLNEREARITGAVASLTGAVKPVTQTQPRRKPGSGKAGQHDPSQKILDDVYAAIATVSRDGKDLTSAELSELLSLSRSTIMRSVAMLREQERVRIVGTRKDKGDDRAGGRGANAYAVMP